MKQAMDRLTVKTVFKWVLGALGAVLVGALGNGAWEWAVRPSLLGARDFLLNVASLGLSTLRDATYREVAANIPEATALFTLGALVWVFAGGLGWGIASLGGLVSKVAEAAAKVDKLRRRAAGETFPEESVADSIATMEKQVASMLVRARRVRLSLTLLFIALYVAVTVRQNQLRFVLSARAHIERLIAQSAPHISEEAEEVYWARLASIEGRDDFIQLSVDLSGVVTQAGGAPARFAPW